MCACSPGYVCSRCKGTPQDWRYWVEPDPAEREAERRDREWLEQAAHPRPWKEAA